MQRNTIQQASALAVWAFPQNVSSFSPPLTQSVFFFYCCCCLCSCWYIPEFFVHTGPVRVCMYVFYVCSVFFCKMLISSRWMNRGKRSGRWGGCAFLASSGCVWVSCARVCVSCVSQVGEHYGIFIYFYWWLPEVEKGRRGRWSKVEVCMKGLFPWQPPTLSAHL